MDNLLPYLSRNPGPILRDLAILLLLLSPGWLGALGEWWMGG